MPMAQALCQVMPTQGVVMQAPLRLCVQHMLQQQPPPPPMHSPTLRNTPMLQHLQPPQRPPSHVPQSKTVAGPLEVAMGVESLYQDELKPYGRILRKRIAEQAQNAGHTIVEVGIKELRIACEACPWLCVEDVEGADWAAHLLDRPASFVDVYSPQDLYTEDLWQAAAAYFENLDDSNIVLPGGRYSCAQVLMQRNLPFLAGRSLGQVCHIVQLAISQKKILGYLNGTVVPYSRSQSMVKEKNAERQRPCSGKGYVATWEVLHSCLEELLKDMAAGEQSIPLSNVKRLFRAQFHTELSETALGYAKLSELLQDPRMHDLCDVKLQGHGYVIVPTKRSQLRNKISLASSLPMEAQCPPPPRGAQAGGRLLRKRAAFVQPLSMEEILSDDLPSSAVASQLRPMVVERSESGNQVGCTSTPSWTPFPPTPSPSSMHARSLPRLLGATRPRQQAAANELCKGAGRDGSPSRVLVASSPSAKARAATTAEEPGVVQTATPRRLPGSGCVQKVCMVRPGFQGGVVGQRAYAEYEAVVLTKRSTLEDFGFSVHNTFIHAAMPPPTPLKVGSHHRARSLPRDTF